ncbi:conserved hypothetical protein [Ricinus communis]|uniref:Uncharacterized protein n=1 Tax=Ricinus communis TaxID=3988 RepID=B9TF48_RICCO|nr:conserved hypothetical protein [Ricinus communis]
MRLVQLIEGDGFVVHGAAGMLQRRDALEQIPGALVIVGGEHAAAAQRVTAVRIAAAIETAAGDRQRFKDGDIAAGHAGVANHERRGGQRTYAAANQIRFRHHTLPWLR